MLSQDVELFVSTDVSLLCVMQVIFSARRLAHYLLSPARPSHGQISQENG